MTFEKKEKGIVIAWQDPNIIIDGKTYFVPSDKRWTAKEAQPGDGAEFVQHKGTISGLWIIPATQKQIPHEETVKKATAAGFDQPAGALLDGTKEVMTEVEQKVMIARSQACTPSTDPSEEEEPTGEVISVTIGSTLSLGNYSNVRLEIVATDAATARLNFKAEIVETVRMVRGIIKEVGGA